MSRMYTSTTSRLSQHLLTLASLSVLWLGSIANAKADDSILIRRVITHDAATLAAQEVLHNPALRYAWTAPSLSALTLQGASQPASTARMPQLGTGGRCFGVEAQSFQRLSKHDVVWGEASYENGRTYDVVWNETSDFVQLYPYVMADERGGDTKYEQYKLKGGYSALHQRLSYGLELGYRALSEYRDRDPRPNNTVADLQGQMAIGYQVTSKQTLALAIALGKYKQTNDLAYYNELGAQKEYHLTGVGNDFARFSGGNNSTFYKGYHWGADLTWASPKATGWSANVGYRYTQREKILTNLNRLPLNKLDINTWVGAVGYAWEGKGIRLQGSYADRQGQDNLFGDASGNIYPLIGATKQYDGNEYQATLSGYGTWHVGSHLIYNIEPQVKLYGLKSHHQTSGNLLSTCDVEPQIAASVAYLQSHNLFEAHLSLSHRFNVSNDLQLYSSVAESMTTLLTNLKQYYADGETSWHLMLNYTRRIAGNKALTFGLGWKHGLYLSHESDNRYEAHITFTL